MNRRLREALTIVVAVAAMIAADPCAAEDRQSVTDMAGRRVTLPRSPGRIICISPGTLRLVLYAGGKDRVVGVEDMEKANPGTRPYWIANGDLGRLPSIGPGGPNTINKQPDLEKVLAADPDLIFISYMDPAKADHIQRKIGIPIVVLSYGPLGSFSEVVYDAVALVGRILDRNLRAAAVIDFIEASRKELASRAAGLIAAGGPTVYVGGIGFKGSHGIESTETRYAPFEWVSAHNIAATTGGKGHRFVDKEKILSWNPDIIFIDSGGSELVCQDYRKRSDFYHGLKAFTNRQVYTLHSFNWYMTNIGTVIADAWAVGKILHPQRFADVDLAQKADEIYRFLVGRPVHRQMTRVFGGLGEVPAYLQR